MGCKRGRLIDESSRREALSLVKEATQAGARKQKVCTLLNISLRTLERWEKPQGLIDKRKEACRPIQGNQLSEEEREALLKVANSERYRDLPPNKIVPLLADEGIYLASESTFYRVLREKKQLKHRGRSKPARHHKPKPLRATGPNQVWSWDISYLPTRIKGQYFYLYAVMDIYSRKLVGWQIHTKESSALGASLVSKRV